MRDEFKITRQGKQYVLFAGLLDEAHSHGLAAIDTELVQIPEDANGQVAITKAIVTIEKPDQSTGEVRQATFSGIGDASPQNVARNIVPHLIRMSETRAKARALRDAVNVAASALEEIDDGDSGSGGSSESSVSGGNTRRDSSSGKKGQMHAVDGGKQGSKDQSPEPPAQEQGDPGYGQSPSGSAGIAGRGQSKAPQSQIDFIKTLAEEWRGEKGVERLEIRIGKPIAELSRDEAESWIDRLTPKDQSAADDDAAEGHGG